MKSAVISRFFLAVCLCGPFLLTGVPLADAPSTRQQIARAEDARDASPQALAPILKAARSSNPADQRRAARALGRFEQPSLIKEIVPLLKAKDPKVRAEAANALAQAVSNVPRDGTAAAEDLDALNRARQLLLALVRSEGDPFAAGAAAEALGRLPLTSAEQITASEQAIARLLPAAPEQVNRPMRAGGGAPQVSVHPDAAKGALKGLDALARLRDTPSLEPDTVTRVRALAGAVAGAKDPSLAEMRRLAMQVLATVRGGDKALFDERIGDEDAQVRRLAMVVATRLEDGTPAADAIAKGLTDDDPMVRVEALRAYGRQLQAKDCTPVITATSDDNVHVALEAIDQLGNGCPEGQTPDLVLAFLLRQTVERAPGAGTWHRFAHAVVSFAKLQAQDAGAWIDWARRDPAWQVRVYAARAAVAIKDPDTLRRLDNDESPNVREAAIEGLKAIDASSTEPVAVAALTASDYQIVRAAALALKGATNRERAITAVLAAFQRVTAEGRQTSRDARMALLDRLEELGSASDADIVSACATDGDPAIARRCAAMASAWSGNPVAAAPRAVPPAPEALKALDEAAGGALDAARLRVTMHGGKSFELRLLADEAPASVARIVSLARAGYYNGLTFHRVVRNFVVQGGSPGANEYVGDGAFMRDELGVPNRRGTVGVSTRGRDTGDAQLFVNLVDNPRLDHHYTVFAEITSGMDLVDAILEGDVMDKVEIVGGRTGS